MHNTGSSTPCQASSCAGLITDHGAAHQTQAVVVVFTWVVAIIADIDQSILADVIPIEVSVQRRGHRSEGTVS
jgi:hypothetical protein